MGWRRKLQDREHAKRATEEARRVAALFHEHREAVAQLVEELEPIVASLDSPIQRDAERCRYCNGVGLQISYPEATPSLILGRLTGYIEAPETFSTGPNRLQGYTDRGLKDMRLARRALANPSRSLPGHDHMLCSPCDEGLRQQIYDDAIARPRSHPEFGEPCASCVGTRVKYDETEFSPGDVMGFAYVCLDCRAGAEFFAELMERRYGPDWATVARVSGVAKERLDSHGVGSTD